ncbi:MAG TPA: UPF0146 family protein, partial [Candidatus Acidoferrales bacterium]|nr:UPF0146 family protein [Candidatus Acidoferrales bacterium]
FSIAITLSKSDGWNLRMRNNGTSSGTLCRRWTGFIDVKCNEDLAHDVAQTLASFIQNNYSTTIAEVGCGRYSATAQALRPFFKVIATDILERQDVDNRMKPIYAKDDVQSPDLRLYRGANLVYSVRPPLEIQPSILDLSERLGADALIKPFGSEIIADRRLSLCNCRGLAFYLFRHATFDPIWRYTAKRSKSKERID